MGRAVDQLTELTEQIEDHNRSSVSMDCFYSVRTRVARSEADIASVLQFRNSAASSSPSRYNLTDGRYPVPVVSGNRNELNNFWGPLKDMMHSPKLQ